MGDWWASVVGIIVCGNSQQSRVNKYNNNNIIVDGGDYCGARVVFDQTFSFSSKRCKNKAKKLLEKKRS